MGPRWCQNYDYAQSETEGIVMVLTSSRAHNLNCALNETVNICFIYQMKETKLPRKNINACVNMIFLGKHNTHSTPIDCARGTVILVGTVEIMPTLLTNQMTGIFG